MDISLDLDLDLDALDFELAGREAAEPAGDADATLMDVSVDLNVDQAPELGAEETLDEFEFDLDELDTFDVFDPDAPFAQFVHMAHDGDTESEPELPTPTVTPPFRPLSTMSVTSDVELDPHRVKLPLASVGASFVRRLAANGLRC